MRRIRSFASSTSSAGSRIDTYVNHQPDVDPAKLVPLKTIGKGCFGKVVLSKWEDELVAVKIIPKTTVEASCLMEKIRAELRIMKAIAASSPFLCYCRGAFQSDQVLLLAMNYASCGDLLFHLQLEGSFDEGRVRVMMMQIVLGLQHLHLRGVVHRDLKLENILVTSEGRIQISDFGLSKFLPRLKSTSKSSRMDSVYASHLTEEPDAPMSCFPTRIFSRTSKSANSDVVWGKANTICGTPAYRAPEVIEGKEYGMEVDYWALGCMAYECLTGWSAFRGKTLKALNKFILKDQPRLHNLRRPISTAAKKFVLALLAKDPMHRLGFGSDGARKVRSHAFFVGDKGMTFSEVSWDHVRQLEIPATVLLNQGGVARNPEQANCFPEEFINLSVMEEVAVPTVPFDVEGFYRIPNFWVYDKFAKRPTPSAASTCAGPAIPSMSPPVGT